jgi:anti-sigma factor RsiW
MIHDHEWDETLSAHIDHDLPAAEAAAVAQHVHDCVACRLALEELRGVKAALAEDHDAGIAVPEAWGALRKNIAGVARRRQLLRWTAAAAAALVIVSTVTVLASFRSTSDVPVATAPITAAMDASLAVVDRAIKDARSALVKDPHDPFLIDYLEDLQRTRMKVLLEFSLRLSDQA